MKSACWAALAAASAASAAGGACSPEDSPIMRPGEDCLVCHNGSAAPKWTAAGTVFGALDAAPDAGLRDVAITIVDATGKTLVLTSNSAGNFYTAAPFTPPFAGSAARHGFLQKSDGKPPSGACNSCHAIPPTNNALGRLYLAPN